MTMAETTKATVIGHILRERERQIDKWGDPPHDDAVWNLILTGEVGEAARAAMRGYPEEHPMTAEDQQALYDELVQVSAVAAAWAETVYRRMSGYGQPPHDGDAPSTNWTRHEDELKERGRLRELRGGRSEREVRDDWIRNYPKRRRKTPLRRRKGRRWPRRSPAAGLGQ